jgi:hypothetical protein
MSYHSLGYFCTILPIRAMKTLLKLEEAVLFTGCLLIFPYLGLSWWWFAGCILLPDLGMAGYLINTKTGAWLYNLFHHKGVAVVVGLLGIYVHHPMVQFAGLILFAHASMDRMLGYGLKYEQGFQYTHLGLIGKQADQ